MKKLVLGLIVAVLMISGTVSGDEVKLLDKDELKAMMGNPDLVVLDVRAGKDWSSSEFKIKDAVRLTNDTTEAVMKDISKDKTLVFYCA
jgi:rhodanese-related sulfurtransferase